MKLVKKRAPRKGVRIALRTKILGRARMVECEEVEFGVAKEVGWCVGIAKVNAANTSTLGVDYVCGQVSHHGALRASVVAAVQDGLNLRRFVVDVVVYAVAGLCELCFEQDWFDKVLARCGDNMHFVPHLFQLQDKCICARHDLNLACMLVIDRHEYLVDFVGRGFDAPSLVEAMEVPVGADFTDVLVHGHARLSVVFKYVDQCFVARLPIV